MLEIGTTIWKFIQPLLLGIHKLLDKFYRNTNLQNQLYEELKKIKTTLLAMQNDLTNLKPHHILEQKLSNLDLKCHIYNSKKEYFSSLPVEIINKLNTCYDYVEEILKLSNKYNETHQKLIISLSQGGLSPKNFSDVDFSKISSGYTKIVENYKTLDYFKSQLVKTLPITSETVAQTLSILNMESK